MAITAAAASSWMLWHSVYAIVISALTASACTIVLEMVLSFTRPRAARALFGVGGGVWMVYALVVAASVAAALLLVSVGP